MNCLTFNRNCITFVFLILLPALTLCAASAAAQEYVLFPRFVKSETVQPRPVNLDFEQGTRDDPPIGWSVPTRGLGFSAELVEGAGKTGKRAAVLRDVIAIKPTGLRFGNLMQAIDAAPFRGRRVRLRAAMRLEANAPKTSAALWMRVDGQNGQLTFFDSTNERSVSFDNTVERSTTSGEWQYYEIIGDVEEDAAVLNVGMLMRGLGKAYLDDVSVEDLGKTVIAAEAARPLSKRNLENLLTFTRLLGYVRHFHPSDEAAATDWDAFAVNGVRVVEEAKNARELAVKLETLFRPIAPTVRIYPTGKRPVPDAASGLTPPENGAPVKIVSWRHKGFAVKNSIHYAFESERVSEEVSAAKTILGNYRLPAAAELGGGVSFLVPLAVFADSNGTLPRSARMLSDSDRGIGKLPYSGNDRATRLAAVALAWNVPQHFYPYFDVVKTDWNAALLQALKSAATDADEKVFIRTLRRMIANLQDGHGRVHHPSQKSLEALPIVFGWIENRLVVTRVTEGIKDLQPGDIVLSIDGKPSDAALAEAESLVSAATPQYRRYVALNALRAGETGTEAKLVVQNESGEKRVVSLRRKVETEPLHDVRPDKVTEIKPGIFYVDLDRITLPDFTAALPKLEKAKGIIFDMRGYPKTGYKPLTHLSEKPLDSPKYLMPLITRPNREQIEDLDQSFSKTGALIPPALPYLAAKKVFITDGRAISFAETFLQTVKAYKLGEIVGEATAGTNGNVNPFMLPGNYRITWTGLKVLNHDGSRLHGVGIEPDVPVSRTIKGVREKRDEQLERAIKTLNG